MLQVVPGSPAERLADRNLFFLDEPQFKRNDYSQFEPTGRAFAQRVASAVAAFTASFMLGIGDRHQGNIFLASNGCVLHIDFAYAFGEMTRIFDAVNFPVPWGLVNMMKQNEVWGDFKKMCWKAKNTLSMYESQINHVLQQLVFSPQFVKNATDYFRNAAAMDETDFSLLIERGQYYKLPKDGIHLLC